MYLVHTIGSECCGEVELDGGEVKAYLDTNKLRFCVCLGLQCVGWST